MAAALSPGTALGNLRRSLAPSQARTSASRRIVVVRAAEGAPSPAAGACPGCGRAGGPAGGCDGKGRVAGGLGAVAAWWPIKAYRPCPDFLQAGKTYTRVGQSLNEVAFGAKTSGDNKSLEERLRGE